MKESRWIKGCFILMLAALLAGCAQHYVKLQPSYKTHGQFHRVQKKETVYAISRQYKVPPRDIIEKNKLKPPYSLSVGQLLFIPPVQVHIVRKGDTLYSISRAYNVDMNSLAKANHIEAPYTLSLGQTLVMPGTLVPATSQSSKKAAQATKTAAVRKTPAQSSTKTTKKTASKPVTLPKAPSRSGRFSWPVSGTVISNFGPSGGGRHNDGINIKASRGTPFKAAENGVVAYAGNELKGFGNLLLIKHADGFVTAYAHADSLSVKRGQTVKKGQTLGKVGSTGNVNAPQLHFEIRKGTKAINPRTYLSQ